MVALGTLSGVHGGVLYGREVDVVFFLSVCEFNPVTFKLCIWARGFFLAEGDALRLADLLVELNHITLGVCTVRIIVAMLIDEDLTPERVLAHVDTLIWLEEGLSRELLLSSLLPTLNDPSSSLADPCD